MIPLGSIIDAPQTNPWILAVEYGVPAALVVFVLYHLGRSLCTGDWSVWRDPPK